MFQRKDLVRLILPIVLEQILAGLLAIADVYMVSFAGEVAVSGVSLVGAVNQLFSTLFTALATGGAIVCTQYLGRGDGGGASVSARHLVVIALGFSVCVTAACTLGNRPFLGALYPSAEAQVMAAASVYFLVLAFSYPFHALFSACSAIFRAGGDTRTPLVMSVLMNLINILLNAVFIYGMGLGVLGAALGSLIARVATGLLMLALLQRRRGKIVFRLFAKERLQWPVVATILRLAVPLAGEGAIFQAAKLMLQGLVTTLGTVAVAANAVAWTVTDMAQTPSYAIGLGMVTVVGYCVGAEEYGQAQRYIRRLVGVSMAVCAALAALCFALAGPIAAAYNLSAATAALTARIIRLQAVGTALFWCAAFNLPEALQAAGDIRFVVWSSVLSTWIFRVGGSYLLCSLTGLGLAGIWLAMMVDWAVRAGLNVWRLRSGRWKHRRVLRPAGDEGGGP